MHTCYKWSGIYFLHLLNLFYKKYVFAASCMIKLLSNIGLPVSFSFVCCGLTASHMLCVGHLISTIRKKKDGLFY